MEKFIYYLITFFILFLGSISKSLNQNIRTRFGKFIGSALRLLSPKREKITLENISKAFPDKPIEFAKEVAKASYQNLGITLVELLAFESLEIDQFKKYIRYDNLELIDEVLSRNKGLILLSGHFGNWEMVAFTVSLFTKQNINFIVKAQKNYIIDKILNRYRSRFGNNVIYSHQSARQIVHILKNKGIIGLLADQSGTEDKDVFVEFFGRMASTYEAPATLALKFDTPIIMGFPIRLENGTYFVKLIELDFTDLSNDREGIIELTKRHVKVLEDTIRMNPGLWAWQHKRWKHSSD